MVDFILSSNPPNPKTCFRLGDWICSSPKCAAHNFGRNLSCIGCGSHRSPSSPTRPPIPSPRFSTHPPPVSTPPPPPPPHDSQNIALQKSSPHHPLLTPSGRAFAVGGKVQNISSDPLNPCIMFWPDNEPFPDQGQIRPSGLVGISQPPILNTGNRGPISHQPGDWICQKCNYLNWRRRKVCQTCLPYAEGNGDSISAAVQAERIALLTNVLARTRLDVNGNYQVPIHPSAAHSPSFTQQLEQINPSNAALPAQRSHSLTPPAERSGLPPALLDISPPAHATINLLHPNNAVHSSPGPLNRPVQRSQSHYALGQQYQQQERYQAQMQRHLAPSPIYQTPLPPAGPAGFNLEHHPGHFQQINRNPSPLPVPLLYSTGPPASPFLGAGLGMAGHRLRVLSSPAPAATSKDWSVNPIAADSVSSSSTSGSTSGSGSISSLASLDIPQLTVGENLTIVDGDRSASGSEMPTPAINTPLLPAFLRDVVSSPLGSKHEEVLGASSDESPRSVEGREVAPEEVVARVNSRLGRTKHAIFPLTALTPVTTNPPPHVAPRARNDSGSSTSSNSSLMTSSSSNNSASRVSLSMSATSLSSAGCGGSNPGSVVGGSIRIRPAAGSVGPHSSSSSPTISTATSCSTLPADSGQSTTSAASASSLPFISFGSGGIWKMDGEESKGWNVPPAQLANQHRHRHVAGGAAGGQKVLNYGHGRHELQGPLPLPVGAERRM